VLAPAAAGNFGDSSTAVYALLAAGCALLATGLLHVLLLGAPRPLSFFVWITGLADVIVAAAPFTQPAPLASKIFTAIINIVVGVAVITLLSGVGRSAARPGTCPVRTGRYPLAEQPGRSTHAGGTSSHPSDTPGQRPSLGSAK